MLVAYVHKTRFLHAKLSESKLATFLIPPRMFSYILVLHVKLLLHCIAFVSEYWLSQSQ